MPCSGDAMLNENAYESVYETKCMLNTYGVTALPPLEKSHPEILGY